MVSVIGDSSRVTPGETSKIVANPIEFGSVGIYGNYFFDLLWSEYYFLADIDR